MAEVSNVKGARARRNARSAAIILLSLAVGAIFGPLAIAGAAAAIGGPETDHFGGSIEAEKLVDAYRDQLPRGLLFLTITPPPDGAECGYDPEIVFPGGIGAMYPEGRATSYSDYQGYSELHRWRNGRRDDAWIRAITARIDEGMTDFQASFLRRCIESTMFADLCAREVERFGETVPRYGRPRTNEAEGFEDRVVCTFVDGVVARKGVPLSPADRVFAD